MIKTRREGPLMKGVVLPDLRARAHYATSKATAYALTKTRQKIRGVGLGRLAGAVGSYDSLKREDTSGNRAYGAIFARGRADGRGNQALLAYSEGATIVPRNGRRWLAFATSAIPKRVGRKKMTPALYRSSGLTSTLGQLHFVMGKGGRVAYLVARNVNVSRRNGQIKPVGVRKPRGADPKKAVVAFVLIPFTVRAQRFSQDAIMRDAQNQVGRFAEAYRSPLKR